MSFLGRLSIGRKLMLLTGSSILTLAVVGWVGYRSVRELSASAEAAGMHVNAMRHLTHVDMEHDAIRAAIFRAIIAAQTNNEAEQTAARLELEKSEKSLQASLGEARKLPLRPETQRSLDLLQSSLGAHMLQAHGIVADASGGRIQKALPALPEFQSAFERVADDLERADDLVTLENNDRREETVAIAASGTTVTVATALVGTLLTLVLSVFIARSITAPLGRMTEAAGRISQGDLLVEVRSNTSDESGALAAAFVSMIEYLRGLAAAADRISGGDLTQQIVPRSDQDVLAHSFKTMVERLRDTSGKIQDGTQVLAASISQIAAATAELSASVAQTSAAVMETASAVEEVKEIAQSAGRKAKEVSDEANQTALVSRDGERAVEDAIDGMKRIGEQMNSIAQSVARLGEQTGTIGEITSSVNELAEQSNLLAINAAIEAAKAGDQGRGFGVVASEVRTLANQSKAATAQIRSILADIQKATGAAIQATEQGKKSVEAGAKQAKDAGQTIRTLATGIAGSADAISHISVSSQQQAIGMEQVGTAIESIRSATDQNARGMRQIESAASDLNKLSQTLKALVLQFKL